MPIFWAIGLFPAPTREIYNTDGAFEFISMLMSNAAYISYLIVIVFAAGIFLLWTKREALAALLIAPITVNIAGFHLFMDGGLLTSGAVLADALLILNVYFLFKNKEKYRGLFMGN